MKPCDAILFARSASLPASPGRDACARTQGTHGTRRFEAARRRPHERGLTLIEIIIAIAIAAVAFAGVIVGIGSLTGQKAKASAAELANVVRSLYDTASLTGKTCRLVFDIADERDDDRGTRYWAECAAGNVTTSRNREEHLKDDLKARQEEAKAAKEASRSGFRRSGDGEPTLQELLEREKARVDASAKYSSFTAPEVEPRDMPTAVKVSIWTRHQRQAVDRGLAYLYFFPQGFTERAHIYVSQGNNVWTLQVSPLTGKTSVVAEKLEIPRS